MAGSDDWSDVPVEATANAGADDWEDVNDWEDVAADAPQSGTSMFAGIGDRATKMAGRAVDLAAPEPEPAPTMVEQFAPQMTDFGVSGDFGDVNQQAELRAQGRDAREFAANPSIHFGANDLPDMTLQQHQNVSEAYNAALRAGQENIGRPLVEAAEEVGGEGANPLTMFNPSTMLTAPLLNRAANTIAPDVNTLLGKTSTEFMTGENFAEETMPPEQLKAAREALPTVNVPGLGETRPLEFAARLSGDPTTYIPGFKLEEMFVAEGAPTLARVAGWLAGHALEGSAQGTAAAVLDPNMSVAEGAIGGAILNPAIIGGAKGAGTVISDTATVLGPKVVDAVRPAMKLTGQAARSFFNDLELSLRLAKARANELGEMIQFRALTDIKDPTGATYVVTDNGLLALQFYKLGKNGSMEVAEVPIKSAEDFRVARTYLKKHGINSVGASDSGLRELEKHLTPTEVHDHLFGREVRKPEPGELMEDELENAIQAGDLELTYKETAGGERISERVKAVTPRGREVLRGRSELVTGTVSNDVHGPGGKTLTPEEQRIKRNEMLRSDGPATKPVKPVNNPAKSHDLPPLPEDPDLSIEQVTDDLIVSIEPHEAGVSVRHETPVKPEVRTEKVRGKKGWIRKTIIDSGGERSFLVDPNGVHTPTDVPVKKKAALDDIPDVSIEQRAPYRKPMLRQVERGPARQGTPVMGRAEEVDPIDAAVARGDLSLRIERMPGGTRHYYTANNDKGQSLLGGPASTQFYPFDAPKPYKKPMFRAGRKEGPELPPWIEMERATPPRKILKSEPDADAANLERAVKTMESSLERPLTPEERAALTKQMSEPKSEPAVPDAPATGARSSGSPPKGVIESPPSQAVEKRPTGQPKPFAIRKNSDGSWTLTDKRDSAQWRVTRHASAEAAANESNRRLAGSASGGGGDNFSKGPPGGPPPPQIPPEVPKKPLPPEMQKKADEAAAVARNIGVDKRPLLQRGAAWAKRNIILRGAALTLGGHHYGVANLRNARRQLKGTASTMAMSEEIFRAIERKLPRGQRGELILGDFGKDIQRFIDNTTDDLSADIKDMNEYMTVKYPAAWAAVKDIVMPTRIKMQNNSLELARRFGRDPITEEMVETMRDAGLWDAYAAQPYFVHMFGKDWAKMLSKHHPEKLERAARYLVERLHEYIENNKLPAEEADRLKMYTVSNVESELRRILRLPGENLDETVAKLLKNETLGRALKSMKSRTDIPEPIRDILGPVDSALVRIPESLARQEWLLRNNEVWNNVIAVDPSLVSPIQRMGFTVPIPADKVRYGNAAGKFIADEAADLLHAAKPPDLGPILKAFKTMGRWAKTNQIPFGRPLTWMQNFFGNPVFAYISGGLDPFARPRESGRAWMLAWDIIQGGHTERPFTTRQNAGGKLLGKETFEELRRSRDWQAALLQEARNHGVDEPGLASVEIGGKRHARLLRMMRSELRKQDPNATYWDHMDVAGKALNFAGATLEEISAAYDSIDRTFKLACYISLREKGLRKFNGDVNKAAAWAAEKVLDSFPSYSRMGKAVEAAGAAPILFNNFVRFNTEVIRIAGMLGPRLTGLGREREPDLVARLALAGVSMYALGQANAAIRRANGISDEEAEMLTLNMTTQQQAWRPMVWVLPVRDPMNQQPLVLDMTQFFGFAKLFFGMPQDHPAVNGLRAVTGAFTDNSLSGMWVDKKMEEMGWKAPSFNPEQPEAQRSALDTFGDVFMQNMTPQIITGSWKEIQNTEGFGPTNEYGEPLRSRYHQPNTLTDMFLRLGGVPAVPLSADPNSPAARAATMESTYEGAKDIGKEARQIARNPKLTDAEKDKLMEETPTTRRKLFHQRKLDRRTELEDTLSKEKTR